MKILFNNSITNFKLLTMKKLLTLIVALIASVSLMAQVTSSSISGKVTDNNRGVLPGATVVATHIPSGAQYYAVADANGNYRLLNIRPGGPYKIEYRMVGFQSVIQEDVTATLGEPESSTFASMRKPSAWAKWSFRLRPFRMAWTATAPAPPLP